MGGTTKEKPAVTLGATEGQPNPLRLFRVALIVGVYLIAFTILDFITKQFEGLPGVVTWYPPAGLTYALLLVFGAAFTPAVTVTLFISSLITYRMPQAPYLLLLWAFVISLIYGLGATFLRKRFHFDWQLRKLRDVAWFVCTTVLVSALLAVLSVSSSALSSAMPRSEVLRAIFDWWIGETVGVLTVAPFLLIFVMPALKRFAEGQPVRLSAWRSYPHPRLSTFGQAASIVLVLYLVFGVSALADYHPMFLISLPLIWIALQRGIKGISLALLALNSGVVVAQWLFRFDPAQLGELELLMIVNCIVSLLMGAVVTERKQAEETLQNNEKRFRALVEHSQEEISLVDADGTLTYESPTARRPLGYPANSLVGHNLFDIIHPDERTAATQLLEQVVKHPGSGKEALFRLRHRDGSWRWMEGFLTNLLDDPAVQSVVINYRDITERKRVEQEIVSLAKFPSENPNPVLRLSQDGLVTYANTASEALLNMWACAVGGPAPQFWRDLSAQVFASGENKTVDIECDGKVYSMNVTPVTEPGYVNIYGRDITDRQRAEEALKESEIRFRALIENSNDAIILISPEGTIIYRTPAAYRLMGLDPATLPDNSMFSTIHPDDLKDALKSFAQLLQTPDKSLFFQFRVQHSDGSWRWMEGTGNNLLTEPAVGAIVVNYRDITERKQAEEEIKISNDELSMLFELSHSMADADNLEDTLELVNRNAVESIHATFARIALLEDDKYIMRAAYPIRPLDHDLGVGARYPVISLPYTQRILEQNKPMILRASDAGISNEEKKALHLDFAQSICLIPLRSSDSSPTSVKLMGLLILGEARNEAREPFTPEKIRLAQTIGDAAAIAIRRMLLREQTERRLHQLIALSEIDLAIISSSDMVFSLGVLLAQVIEQLRVDAAAIWLFNPTSQMLEFISGRGFRTPAFEDGEALHLGEGNVGQAALERRTIHVPNLTAHDVHLRLKKALAEELFISYFAVPLIVKEQVKGVLELFQRTELEPNDEWLNFLHALSNQAAIAIDNSSLFKDLQESNIELTQAYDATIQGWSRALDLRDKETEGHTQRVTELTIKLGRQFGLSENELVHLRRGALLHDIGKMGVPDAILLKPGPLTDEEWIMMRKHPAFAYEMLSPIHYLKSALDIPYCHHEKWDGSGYPRGLSGDEIPFAARIFAVVDVWDALTSDRPYRAAWPEEKVLDHIRSLVGTHFDPEVVKVCLESGLLSGQKRL